MDTILALYARLEDGGFGTKGMTRSEIHRSFHSEVRKYYAAVLKSELERIERAKARYALAKTSYLDAVKKSKEECSSEEKVIRIMNVANKKARYEVRFVQLRSAEYDYDTREIQLDEMCPTCPECEYEAEAEEISMVQNCQCDCCRGKVNDSW